MSYGVNEVLLASVLGSVVFAFLAGQPLCIVGVTGEQEALRGKKYAKLSIPQVQLRFSIILFMIL